jgi:hypothetical protein
MDTTVDLIKIITNLVHCYVDGPSVIHSNDPKNENKNLNIRDTELFNTNHCFFIQLVLFLFIVFNIYFNIINTCTTKCSLVVNTAGSYLGGPEFKSQITNLLSWFRLLVSSVPTSRCWIVLKKLGHGFLLPHPFQVIIHWPLSVLLNTF